MYILIVNEQPLGRSLAAALVSHGHEVAYVDEEVEFCNMVSAEVGCLVIHGENTNLRILQEAGIERADVVVSLLNQDIKNIMVGLFAKQFNVPRILARLQQQHYRAAYELAGIDNIFSAFAISIKPTWCLHLPIDLTAPNDVVGFVLSSLNFSLTSHTSMFL